MGLLDDIAPAAGAGSMLGPLGTVAGSVIGAGAGLLGDVMQSGSAAASVQSQEQFQEQMSDTVYQRGVADMKAAGLNPLAMYSGGSGMPDPAMSGAAAQPGQFSNLGQGAAMGASTAQNVMQEQADLQQQQQQLRLSHSQAALNNAQAISTIQRLGPLSSAGSAASQEAASDAVLRGVESEQESDLFNAQASMGKPYWISKAIQGTPIPGALGSALSAGVGVAGQAASAGGFDAVADMAAATGL